MKVSFLFNESTIMPDSFTALFNQKTPVELHVAIMNMGRTIWNLEKGYSIPNEKKERFLEILSEYIDTECLTCNHQWLIESGQVSCASCSSNILRSISEALSSEATA